MGSSETKRSTRSRSTPRFGACYRKQQQAFAVGRAQVQVAKWRAKSEAPRRLANQWNVCRIYAEEPAELLTSSDGDFQALAAHSGQSQSLATRAFFR